MKYLATVAVAAIIGLGASTASATVEQASAAAPITAASTTDTAAKQGSWPRWAVRVFMRNCNPRVWRPLSCTDVLHAAERRYSVRQFTHLSERQIRGFVASLY